MSVVQKLYTIEELPTLPEVVLEIQSLVGSEEGSARRCARIIEEDVSLSAKVLKIANSAFFAPNHRISSVQLAIAQIGFVEVSRIVTAVSLISRFSGASSVLDYRQFWRHSLTAAYLTQALAARSSTPCTQEEQQSLFLTGLMHDVGILIYDQFFHNEFRLIAAYGANHAKTFVAAEQEIAAKDAHPAVGSALLELWKMAIPVISGVRFHHEPVKAPEKFRTIASIAALTEYILCKSNESFEGVAREPDQAAWDGAGVSPDFLDELARQAAVEVERSDLIMATEGRFARTS